MERTGPTNDLRDIHIEKRLRNKGVGIELDRYGLRAHQCSTLKTNLVELCRLEETSDLVRAQHLVQSPA